MTKIFNHIEHTKIKTTFWKYLKQSIIKGFFPKCRQTKNQCVQHIDSVTIHYPSQIAEPELQNTTSVATGIHILVFHQRFPVPDI